MKKFFFLIYLVPFLLCVVAVWYFGHHRPEQKKNEVFPCGSEKYSTIHNNENTTFKTTSDARSRECSR